MPIPAVLGLAFASGVAAAVSARSELRLSPRPSLLTRAFGAYALFLALVLIPIAVYFYVFHGDWFLLYMIDVRRIPSAVALVGFFVTGVTGAAGFAIGATFVRSQRESGAGVVAALALALAAGVGVLARARLSLVGSHSQYHGGFGLVPYGSGPLFQGTVLMTVLFVVGLVYLLWRIAAGGRRG